MDDFNPKFFSFLCASQSVNLQMSIVTEGE